MKDRLTEQTTLAESRRIDALLAAANAAVNIANSRAEMTAATLAERVDTTAKANAAQVDITARAAATAVDATKTTLEGRIKPLEDARYVEAGRSGLSTPLLMAIVSFISVVVATIVIHLLATGTV